MAKRLFDAAAAVVSTAAFGATILAGMFTVTPVAHAEVYYPWCAQYSGDDGDSGTNCGFSTLAQCRATISGIGGLCLENPEDPPRAAPVKKAKKPRELR